MTKIYVKLIAMALALTLSVSVVIMSSYAWMVLSKSPAVSGIQVAIGGGNTILIAPNVKTESGYNIPGYFSDKMNFGIQSSYAYLNDLAGLVPVSTANGIDWFISETYADSELMNANISINDENYKDKIKEGHYVYLDFWVVSPSGDYKLRIAAGDEPSVEGTGVNGGSFVIDLMMPEKDAEGNWNLEDAEGSAAASVRIGLLANDTILKDGSMEAYVQSSYNDDRYTALRGMYQEPGRGTPYLSADRFYIYEPNADCHPGNEETEGIYLETMPLAYGDDRNVVKADVSNITAAQLSSRWINDLSTGEAKIGQIFDAFTVAKTKTDATPAQMFADFYGGYLQGQISTYVSKGDFVKYASVLKDEYDLSTLAQIDPITGKTGLSGATEDVYIIELEKNIPQRIRMFIWIEGQDADCKVSSGAGPFAVNIEFAGGNE